MKAKRLAIAIGSLLVASLGATAYAQGAPQTTPPQTPPPATTAYTSGANQATQPMSNSNMANGRIPQKVKQELTSHGVTATNVNVTFDNGTATLTGTVATQRDISKAKSAALRVKGVKHVDTSGLQAQVGHGQGTG
ncbi:MAG TPA: BON domain-containing protein [Rhodanobacteraceae bacterium]|jgi:hyperosmotically inducible protein|nr:BON domain-containing protein [Rhodanobacteraceae bacterium]